MYGEDTVTLHVPIAPTAMLAGPETLSIWSALFDKGPFTGAQIEIWLNRAGLKESPAPAIVDVEETKLLPAPAAEATPENAH